MAFSSERTSEDFLELNSCGIQNLKERDYYTKRIKGRIDYHILYIYQGKCTVEDRENLLTAKAGDIILFKPDEPQIYSFRAQDKSISCYVHFSGEKCEEYLKKIGIYNSRITHIGVSKRIRNLFSNLQFEYLYPKDFSKELSSALMLELLFAIGREKLNISKNKLTYDVRIDEIQKEILRSPSEWQSVSYYADKCNLSISRFHHIFKEQTGLSVKEYISNMRIKYASEILLETDISVSETANMLKYNSATYFIRDFKKQMGMTPNEYKQKYRV